MFVLGRNLNMNKTADETAECPYRLLTNISSSLSEATYSDTADTMHAVPQNGRNVLLQPDRVR